MNNSLSGRFNFRLKKFNGFDRGDALNYLLPFNGVNSIVFYRRKSGKAGSFPQFVLGGEPFNIKYYFRPGENYFFTADQAAFVHN